MIKYIITISVLLLAIAGVILLAIVPFLRSVQAGETELAQQEQVLKNSEDLVAVLNQLTAQFGSLQGDLGKVEIAIPSKEDLPRLLVEIPQLVAQNGMILSNIAFGESDEKVEGYRSTSINLATKGTYLNLKSFLRTLEQNLRLYDVVSIKFGEASNGQHGFEFSIQGYTQ